MRGVPAAASLTEALLLLVALPARGCWSLAPQLGSCLKAVGWQVDESRICILLSTGRGSSRIQNMVPVGPRGVGTEAGRAH